MTKEEKVKKKIEKQKKTINNFFGEFKKFISRGNVVDLAVGVIVGGAFSKIVSSLVDNILMPTIGIIIGGQDFTTLNLKIGDSVIQYGIFLQNVLDFIIVALCIFVFVKIINKLTVNKKEEEEKKKKEEEEKKKKEEEAKKKPADITLLEEIRDLLKKK